MKTKFLVLLISFATVKSIVAQSCTDIEELLRKRHTISGMTYGHPYTMFNRHPNTSSLLPGQRSSTLTNAKFSMDSAIKNIRERIKSEKNKDNSESPIFKAYKLIYAKAKESKPSDNGFPNIKGVSQLAIWAKNNAFVFLVGMNDTGALLDVIDPSGATRNAFRDRAKNEAFNSLTGEIDANNPSWGWWIGPVPGFSYWVANLVEEEMFLSQLQGHSRS